jgi:hypothetical protein
MTGFWNAIGAFALGGVGWFVVSFVGGPIVRFIDLRRETIDRMVLYANVAATSRERPYGTIENLEISEEELERLR